MNGTGPQMQASRSTGRSRWRTWANPAYSADHPGWVARTRRVSGRSVAGAPLHAVPARSAWLVSDRSACTTVTWRVEDVATRLLQDADHGRAADAGRGEQQRCIACVDDGVRVGVAQSQHVPDGDVGVPPVGDLAIRADLVADRFDADAPSRLLWCAGQAVRRICRAPSGRVTATLRYGASRRGHPQLSSRGSPGLPARAGFVEAGLAIQADQGVRHQPVQLVPRGGDLRCHCRAEDISDRGEQVGVEDLVPVGGHAQRGVFVREPRQQLPGVLAGVIHDQGRGT